MNLILLEPEDFIDGGRVRLAGRRQRHIVEVQRAAVGTSLRVGAVGGRIGNGMVTRLGDGDLEMQVALTDDPPAPLPLRLVLALPRPKVLRRVLQDVAAAGVKHLHLVNSWRVEKSYWSSPQLEAATVRRHLLLGLEQGRDTVLPEVILHRLFKPFVEDELPGLSAGTIALVAHPAAADPCPRRVDGTVTLAVGPEGGFIEYEIESLVRAGFRAVSLGPRLLRVEPALAWLFGRLF